MRRKLMVVLALCLLSFTIFTAEDCGGGNDKADTQRDRSINIRAEAFDRAEKKFPSPRTENFPLREVLVEYTKRADMVNHPWYTYILSDTGAMTHYFVSTAVPVNSCAFLGSTEDVRDYGEEDLITTAPSLDGVYYGGAGAAAACNGWIFIDASNGVMGLAFGERILSFEAPLILETEPLLIRPVAMGQ